MLLQFLIHHWLCVFQSKQKYQQLCVQKAQSAPATLRLCTEVNQWNESEDSIDYIEQQIFLQQTCLRNRMYDYRLAQYV